MIVALLLMVWALVFANRTATATAASQKTFYGFTEANQEYLLIYRNNQNYLCVPYNRQKNEFGPGFRIMKGEDIKVALQKIELQSPPKNHAPAKVISP